MNESMLKELNSLPTVLSLKDLKTALRLSDRSMYRIVQDPDLHAFKDGRDWNVLKSDLIEWLEKNE
jgi:hypothetical protein